ATTNVSGLSAYRLMLRRSSSIRNAGGRSCWCRSRYSAISSSAFGVGPANTLVKNRCHNEMPRLTTGASIYKEEAGIALSRQPHLEHPYRGFYLDDVMGITKRSIVRNSCVTPRALCKPGWLMTSRFPCACLSRFFSARARAPQLFQPTKQKALAPILFPRPLPPQWLRQTNVWRGVTSPHGSQKRLRSVKSATRGA